MRELKRVPVSSLRPDSEQPRKEISEAELIALAENMKKHGQQVPVIVYQVDEDEPDRSK